MQRRLLVALKFRLVAMELWSKPQVRDTCDETVRGTPNTLCEPVLKGVVNVRPQAEAGDGLTLKAMC